MRVRDEDGFTLIELIVSMTVLIIVLSATLGALDTFGTVGARNARLADQVDQARTAMDALARQARNATAYQASGDATNRAVLRAGPHDLAFKAVDPFGGASSGNPHRVHSVRYCLAVPAGVLYRQRKAGVAIPSTACPDTTWQTTPVVANVSNGTARPVFTYDSAALADIASIRMNLFLRAGSQSRPGETRLTSGVYVRNLNRAPTAAFTATAAANRHVLLNGSSSVDPDGRLLTYSWQVNGTALPQATPQVAYVAPSAGTYTFTLTVTDPGGLSHSTSQVVQVLA